MVALAKYVLHWKGLGEEGQFGTYVAANAPYTQADVETAAHSVEQSFSTDGDLWGPLLKQCIGPDQQYDSVKCYWYPDAKGPAAYVGESTIGANSGTGTGGVTASLQSSICASLLTGHSGASYRGRLYVPATGLTPNAGHQFPQGVLDLVGHALCGSADGQGSWLEAIGVGGPDGGGAPVVFSRTKNQANAITSVRIDSKPDTQRRRAESLQPTLASSYQLHP